MPCQTRSLRSRRPREEEASSDEALQLDVPRQKKKAHKAIPAIEDDKSQAEDPEDGDEGDDDYDDIMGLLEQDDSDDNDDDDDDDDSDDNDDNDENDNGDEDGLQPPFDDTTYPCYEFGVNNNFKVTLHTILTLLFNWAASNIASWSDLSEDEQVMTKSAASLLAHCNIDFVLNLFLAVIPLSVQTLFVAPFFLEDILSLPNVGAGDTRRGIYGNFPTGNLIHANDVGCETYVGQSKSIWRRIQQHFKLSKISPRLLHQSLRRSLHYNTICRPGVQSNFRALAIFQEEVESGYLMLLETIFTILLGSFQYHGYTHRYGTQAAYDLVTSIRDEVGLPDTPWRGLNAATPMRQSFFRPSRVISPCMNEGCKNLTAPKRLRNELPAESPRGRRGFLNPEDPLGGYVCISCNRWRRRHGHLPDEAKCRKIDYIRLCIRTRPDDKDPQCADCKCRRSDEASKHRKSLNRFRYVPDESLAGFYCDACWPYVKKHGRHRPRTSHGELRTMNHQKGEPCGHCSAPYTAEKVGASHAFNRELRITLCNACQAVFSKNGALPTVKVLAERNLRAARGKKEEIVCSRCSAIEKENPSKYLKHGTDNDGNILCRKCIVAK